MGGIASGRDARDFLLAGARCVAVGTESFRDPAAGRRIAAELDVIYREERGFLPTAPVWVTSHSTKALQSGRKRVK